MEPAQGEVAKERERVLFVMGGAGAGKTSVLTKEVVDLVDLVYDGRLDDGEWLITNINEALRNGWKVEVVYLQRPIDLAAKGTIERANRDGRWESYADIPVTHINTQRWIIEAAWAFADRQDVRFEFWSNDGQAAGDVPSRLDLEDIVPGGRASYFKG